MHLPIDAHVESSGPNAGRDAGPATLSEHVPGRVEPIAQLFWKAEF
jgi:hypothetical protein